MPNSSELARLSLLFGIEVNGERVDRVFLYRATEHILARRFLKAGVRDKSLERLLTGCLALIGLPTLTDSHMEARRMTKARKAHHLTNVAATPNILAHDREPSSSKIASLADDLRATRLRARTQKQIPILDSYALSPSLWLGDDPQRIWLRLATTPSPPRCARIHKFLWQLTVPEAHESADANETETEGVDFFTRALVLQALRRAVLRDSVLLRLLPQNGDLHESGWGELLAAASLTISPTSMKAWPNALSCFWRT